MKLKDLYYMVLGWTLLLLSPSCLEDPEGDGELHNAKAPEVETVTSQIARTATTVTLGGRVIRENGRAVMNRLPNGWMKVPEKVIFQVLLPI